MSVMVPWVKSSSLHQLIVQLYVGTDSLGHSSSLEKRFGVAVWNIIAPETLAHIVQEEVDIHAGELYLVWEGGCNDFVSCLSQLLILHRLGLVFYNVKAVCVIH